MQVSQLRLSEVNINWVVSQKNGNESLTCGYSWDGISTHIPAGGFQRILCIEKLTQEETHWQWVVQQGFTSAKERINF